MQGTTLAGERSTGKQKGLVCRLKVPDMQGWTALCGIDGTVRQSIVNAELVHAAILSGGDDYELCFTASPRCRARIESLGAQLGLKVTRIGRMREGSEVRVLRADGSLDRNGKKGGYDHFV